MGAIGEFGLGWSHEHQHFSQVGAERAVATQPKLQRQVKVLWLVDGLCHGHHATGGLSLRLEETAFIASGDHHLDVVAGHIVGGAHAEDVGGDGDVCWEGEVVVGYSQRLGQALFRLIAKQAFASTATTGRCEEEGARQNRHREKEKKKKVNRVAVHGMQWKEHESAAFTHSQVSTGGSVDHARHSVTGAAITG